MTTDLILTNGRFYTMNPQQPTATAVACRDGKIIAVGTDNYIKSLFGTGGEWIDLNGRCVTPGLVDAHVHFQNFAISRLRVNLDNAQSLAEVLDRIAAYARQLESDPHAQGNEKWLQGRGWSQEQWENRAFPSAAQLDQIISRTPVCLKHKSGHAAWVNTRALKIANITAATPDPPGGQIQRDAQGEPTGILFEDAMNLVTEQIPRPTVSEVATAMRAAQAYCWSVGLTGLHDFDGRTSFQALQSLHQNEELGLRVVKNIPVRYLDHVIGVGLRSGFGDEWLRIGGIKIFADGALGPRTAAMLAPYENEPNNLGIVVTEKEEMLQHALQASANGLSLTVHAIGDRANHDVLDVYEIVRSEERQRAGLAPVLRHRIEHVQIIHPSDLPRLAELNVIASMQPTHATSDMLMADRNWGSRARTSYAIGSVLASGAALAFGSDAPIEEIDPLPGIHAAVTRRRADGSPGADGWYPEQKIDMTETIKGFTWGTAVAGGQEQFFGSTTAGKLADFTIFDQDIFVIPADELLDVKIAATIVGGNFKYRR